MSTSERMSVIDRFVLEEDRLFDIRKDRLLRECRIEALVELLEEFKNRFPLYVVYSDYVVYSEGVFRLMHYLGQVGNKCLFYWSSDESEMKLPLFWIGVDVMDESRRSWFLVYQEAQRPLFSFIQGVCDLLERGKERDLTSEVVVPSGLFVLRYTAHWDAEGKRNPPVIVTYIVRVSSFNEARKELKSHMSGRRESFFTDLSVYLDGEWRRIKIRNKVTGQSSPRLKNTSCAYIDFEFVLY